MISIKLVEPKIEDYDEYYRIRSSPSDIYWNGYSAKPNYEAFKEEFLKRIDSAPFEKPDDRRVYLVQNEDGIYIGFTQMIRREACIELSYAINEDFQGRGYATEALKQTITAAQQYSDTIVVRIRDDNIASQRVAEKCGFKKTDNYIEKNYPQTGIVKLRSYILS